MAAFLQEVTFNIEVTKEIRVGRLISVDEVNEWIDDDNEYILWEMTPRNGVITKIKAVGVGDYVNFSDID